LEVSFAVLIVAVERGRVLLKQRPSKILLQFRFKLRDFVFDFNRCLHPVFRRKLLLFGP
jgi:hypothetical protein